MSTVPDYRAKALSRTIKALREDLIDDSGPKISTMRNYRFAIVVYAPEDEWELRDQIRELAPDLASHGWVMHSISLQKLMIERLRRELGDDALDKLVELERRLSSRAPERALKFLKEKIIQVIEGPDGLAADIAADIDRLVEEDPERAERTVVFLGRTGALYPFMRTSALLKHLDGRTHNLPVVLLYPGKKEGDAGLSFMGQLPPDRDYRPRIYTPDSYKL
ncbi:MAG: DUF1788 domain-containing protein [Persicimonas sp.]